MPTVSKTKTVFFVCNHLFYNDIHRFQTMKKKEKKMTHDKLKLS
jgi:pyrrolidone-carboxylate peptidase